LPFFEYQQPDYIMSISRQIKSPKGRLRTTKLSEKLEHYIQGRTGLLCTTKTYALCLPSINHHMHISRQTKGRMGLLCTTKTYAHFLPIIFEHPLNYNIRHFIPEHFVPTYATKPLELNHYLNHLPTHILCRSFFYIIRQLTHVLRPIYIRKRFYHEQNILSPPTHICRPFFYIPEHLARQTRNLYFLNLDNDQLKKTKHTQIGEVDGVRTEPSTGTTIS
jgi:hypothetical protein